MTDGRSKVNTRVPASCRSRMPPTQPTLAGAGVTAVIKLKPGEAVPELAGGIRAGDIDGVRGLHIVKHTEWRIPWREEGSYAEVRATTHRNLFRITLPD